MSDAPNDADAAIFDEHLTQAWQRYRGGDPQKALTHTELALAIDKDNGRAWTMKAYCLERLKRLREADHCFSQAARSPREATARPYRVSWKHFERAVEYACDLLPDRERQALTEIDLVLRNYPDPELVQNPNDAELLGIFEGPCQAEYEAEPESWPIPPRVSLFRRAHEHNAGSDGEFNDTAYDTLVRQLHYFLGVKEDTDS